MKITLHSLATEVYVGRDLLNGTLLREFCGEQKVVIIADAVVRDLYGAKLAEILEAPLLTIPSGERAKTTETQEQLMGELFKMGIGKDTTLIALGGGVTTDLVGFIASIYMRGVVLILIPTTLLAMVDAAIGGKTALDTPFGKNLIGTIYHPKAVFIDLETLNTLPQKEVFNGFAEILKMGLIHDAAICDAISSEEELFGMILQAIKAKIAIVEQDPTEQGLRRILNFGHTVGHALETIADYQLAHGEAVAIGSLAEAHLSMQLGYLAEKDFAQIQKLYHNFSLQLPKAYNRDRLLQAMVYDKKRAKGVTRFVLIDRIGHALPFAGVFCRPVALNELEPSLKWMEKCYGSV